MVTVLGIVSLVVALLLHLQFALQAFAAAPPQGVLVLVATIAFGMATPRMRERRKLAHIIFLGTVPLFLFSLVTPFFYDDESWIFAAIFGVAPALSGIAWLLRRDRVVVLADEGAV